jgi:hypothetical protein
MITTTLFFFTYRDLPSFAKMHLFGVAQTLQDHQTQTDNHRNALEAKIVKDTNILKQEFVYHSNRLSQQIIR